MVPVEGLERLRGGRLANISFILAKSVTSTSLDRRFDAVLEQFLAANPQVSGVVASISSPSRQLEWSGAAGLAERATGRFAAAADVFPRTSKP